MKILAPAWKRESGRRFVFIVVTGLLFQMMRYPLKFPSLVANTLKFLKLVRRTQEGKNEPSLPEA